MAAIEEILRQFQSPRRLLSSLVLFWLFEVFSSRTPSEILLQSALRDIDFKIHLPGGLRLNNKPKVDCLKKPQLIMKLKGLFAVKMPFYCVVYSFASKEKIGDHEQENKNLFFHK